MNDGSKNIQSFDTVWQTINDKHFDPTFGGLDWNDVYDRYKPQITSADNDVEFYYLVNKMLFELNLSHIAVVNPEALQQTVPILSAEGSIGIDVRILGDIAVITSVKPESPGDRAGLRAGYIIKSINGKRIGQVTDLKYINDIDFQKTDQETIKNLKVHAPPYNKRNRHNRMTVAILEELYGSPGTVVSMAYIDENGDTLTKKLMRTSRKGKMVLDDTLPPFFIEFEDKRLRDNIDYIRFNAFMPPVDKKFIDAVDSMHDTAGIIIDIRGNPGGFFPVRKVLAEKIMKNRTLFWRYKERDEIRDVYLDPSEKNFSGPVVVLIDTLSESSSEEFAGGMQAIGRAAIVGERSPGRVLVAESQKLENGGVLWYAWGQTMTADGSILEGNGVVPDVEVALDRNTLLKGKDIQLEAAIGFINKRGSSPKKLA